MNARHGSRGSRRLPRKVGVRQRRSASHRENTDRGPDRRGGHSQERVNSGVGSPRTRSERERSVTPPSARSGSRRFSGRESVVELCRRFPTAPVAGEGVGRPVECYSSVEVGALSLRRRYSGGTPWSSSAHGVISRSRSSEPAGRTSIPSPSCTFTPVRRVPSTPRRTPSRPVPLVLPMRSIKSSAGAEASGAP